MHTLAPKIQDTRQTWSQCFCCYDATKKIQWRLTIKNEPKNTHTHTYTHTSRQTKPIVFSTVTTEATNNNQIMMLEPKTMFDNDIVLRLSLFFWSSMDECMYACNICNKPLNLTVYYDYYQYKRIYRGVKRLKQKQLRKNILLTESELLWPESVNRVFHASEDATGTVVAKMYHEKRLGEGNRRINFRVS